MAIASDIINIPIASSRGWRPLVAEKEGGIMPIEELKVGSKVVVTNKAEKDDLDSLFVELMAADNLLSVASKKLFDAKQRFFDRLNEYHPELKRWELSFNRTTMTATIMAAREI